MLKEQAAQGHQPKMNPERAQARADELAGRMRRRLAELEEERRHQALPPVLVGAALVIPAGLLAALGDPDAATASHLARETRIIEERAMRAVLDEEARLGRHVEAMSHSNPGFDIRSIDAGGHLLLIEVKGRIEGSTTVSVTRNEILTGLNAADHCLLALVEVRGNGTCEVPLPAKPLRRQVARAALRRALHHLRLGQALGRRGGATMMYPRRPR